MRCSEVCHNERKLMVWILVYFRSTNVRFSFQNLETKCSPEQEKGPPSTGNVCPKCMMRSSVAGVRSSFQIRNPHKKARTMEAEVQTSPPKDLSKSAEWANLIEVGCKTMLPDSPDSSLEMVDDSKSERKSGTPKKPDYAQVFCCTFVHSTISSLINMLQHNSTL